MITSALALPALALCLIIITFLALVPSQKDAILRRVGLFRGPNRYYYTTSAAEKQPLSKPQASYVAGLATAFPPSQRGHLKDLMPTLSPSQQRILGSLSFNQDAFERSVLRLEEDYRKADDSKYIYSSFSVREIKALGDFPDYSALSGVPMPNPYRNFDINKAKPRPYRPVRWPYHQTMSLMKFEPDWWIELESTYVERIKQRQELYAKHGPLILQWMPGTELACKELMEMAIQFVCARYPQYFALSGDELWLENRILGTKANIREKHPLLVLLDHIPEDFFITVRDPETGHYVARAGLVCSALGWSVGDKIGLKLHEIHERVPDYKERMQLSMDRYFSKMPTDKPIQRGSWGIEVGQPLFMAPGDPHAAQREVQDKGLERAQVHMRVDWQTLRRLPLSGAVAFNFKAVFTPIDEFRDEPYVPGLLLQVLRRGKEHMMAYKNSWHTEHVLLPALEEYEREQKESGLIERDWDVRTLDESPFFPGWEKKWHAKQGF